MTSLSRTSLAGALAATALTTVIAFSAGFVRLAPWLLDPAVSWRVAAPFARSLAIVALEAAFAVGWPLGWAFATRGFVARGEARVLGLLGERPARTATRLLPPALVFTAFLATLSWASARESTEPGRVVTELIADGRAACLRTGAPRTYVVPFLGATWLCDPACSPRLVGQGPGALSALVFSAANARVSGDLGALELDDARLALPAPHATIHVDALRVRGSAPWGARSSVSPWVRAVALALAVAASALGLVALALVQRSQGRLHALVAGAVGPIGALGLLRLLERFPGHLWGVALVPPLSLAAVIGVGWGGARLPALWHAASR